MRSALGPIRSAAVDGEQDPGAYAAAERVFRAVRLLISGALVAAAIALAVLMAWEGVATGSVALGLVAVFVVVAGLAIFSAWKTALSRRR